MKKRKEMRLTKQNERRWGGMVTKMENPERAIVSAAKQKIRTWA